jgi:UPF0755 protein
MVKFIRIVFLLLVLLSSVIGGAGYWIYENKLKTPLPLLETLHYTIPPKTNLAEVAIDLMQKEILDYPSALTWVMLARWQGRAHLIKAGDYLFPQNTTPQDMLNILIKGQTTTRQEPKRSRTHPNADFPKEEHVLKG